MRSAVQGCLKRAKALMRNHLRASANKTPPAMTAISSSVMRMSNGGSDCAVTADGGDYAVHIVVGIDPDGRMYLLDLWRKQTASDEWIEAFCNLLMQWKPVGWAEVTSQSGSTGLRG